MAKVHAGDMVFLAGRNRRLAWVESVLSVPPKLSTVERPELHGDRVQRFVLPNEICKPTNATRHGQAWALGVAKKRIWDLMFMQAGGLREAVMLGRPQIIAIRFSSSESDPYADWAKAAVDMLRLWRDTREKHPITKKIVVRKIRGLGFIDDDKGSHIELRQRWEPCKPKQGFTYIEIRTGVPQ